jgi:DNA recombination protein RmuC
VSLAPSTLVVAGALLAGAAIAAVVSRLLSRPPAPDPRIDELRRIVEEARDRSADSKASVATLSQVFAERLGSFEKTVDKRITDGQSLMGLNLNTMQQQSAESAKLLKTVGENLGQVLEASKKIAGLATEVTRLEDLLKAPKLRGGLGEHFLEETLRQVLPPGAFEMQRRFAGGETVDAAIRLGDKWVVVDSKFPLENYRRSLDLENETDKKNARAAFFRDVRKHVESIASKYIRPAENTMDFALMYIPAEAVYCEIVSESGEKGVLELAISRKVIPVSPLLFYVYLYTIAIGLKGMEIEQRAQDIVKELGDLKRSVGKIDDPLQKLGGHLGNAQKQFETTSKELSRFAERLREVGEADVPAETVDKPDEEISALPLRLFPQG